MVSAARVEARSSGVRAESMALRILACDRDQAPRQRFSPRCQLEPHPPAILGIAHGGEEPGVPEGAHHATGRGLIYAQAAGELGLRAGGLLGDGHEGPELLGREPQRLDLGGHELANRSHDQGGEKPDGLLRRK